MSKTGDPSRRAFLSGAGALCIGVSLGTGLGCGGGGAGKRIRKADATGELDANIYITILPSGRVRLAVPKSEIGQGVITGYATLVAEELEVDLASIDCLHADSLPEYRMSFEGIPMFKIHQTGGSTSMLVGWKPLRQAGAAAREMLVAAAARRWRVKPGECRAEAGIVRHAASGRTLGYGDLTRAAARLEAPANPRLKKAGDYRVIGKRQQRRDVAAKVDGTAVYGIDVEIDDMVIATVIHAPVFGARARSVDAEAARRQPGVIAVFEFFAGVAVVAEKFWQAQRAAKVVDVKWGKGRVEGLDTAVMARAARAHQKAGAVVRETGSGRVSGAGTIEAVYEAPHLAQAPLEPQNCTARVRGSKAEIWAPCQVPTVVQEAVADAIDIDAEDVLVHTTFSGGGFGRRLLGDYAAQAAAIAKHVKRPVKMIWSRESDMRQGYYRPAATARLRGRVVRGRADALTYHSISQPITPHQLESARGGMPSIMPRLVRQIMATSVSGAVAANTSVDMFATEGASDTPYQIPNMKFEFTPLQTGMPVGFWRSVGHSFNGFFIEGFVDELADAARIDPFLFRRQMLPPGGRQQRVLDAVAELSGWRDGPRPGHGFGIARHTSFQTEVAEVAEVTLVGERIRVTRVFCAVDCGVAVNPDVIRAQMEGAIIYGLGAALDQKITLANGVVQQGNFDDFPSLRMHEAPSIEVVIMDSTNRPTGVGEPGLPCVAPAVANGLFALSGVRLRQMPLQEAYDRRREAR